MASNFKQFERHWITRQCYIRATSAFKTTKSLTMTLIVLYYIIKKKKEHFFIGFAPRK